MQLQTKVFKHQITETTSLSYEKLIKLITLLEIKGKRMLLEPAKMGSEMSQQTIQCAESTQWVQPLLVNKRIQGFRIV